MLLMTNLVLWLGSRVRCGGRADVGGNVLNTAVGARTRARALTAPTEGLDGSGTMQRNTEPEFIGERTVAAAATDIMMWHSGGV